MSESGTDLAVTLGDVAAEPIEQTGPTRNFVYVDISSIDRESKRIVGEKEISAVDAPSRAKQILRSGDVLVSMTRPNLNAVSIVPDRLDGAIASTGFHVLRSKWVEPKFLFNLVQTDEFIDSMCNVVQGALYPAVRPKDIASFAFTLPSSNQQTRIIEKLEELLSDLDAGVAELKTAQAKLVRYRQSLLKAAVEGALTAEWRAARAGVHPPPRAGEGQGGGAVPPSQPSPARGGRGQSDTGAQLLQRILSERRARWEAKQLAKFAEQGKAPPKDWQKKYPEPVQPDISDLPELPGGWVWATVDQLSPDDIANGRSVPTSTLGTKVLRLTAIKSGRIDQAECKIGAWSEDEAQPFSIVEGDLLIARGNGSLNLVGRAGIVGSVRHLIAYPDTMIRLRIVDSVVSASWINLVWESKFVRTHLQQRARTSAGIYKISQPDIVSAPIPVGPLEEQAEIIGLIERTFDHVGVLQKYLHASSRQSTAQRKNILRAAFAGQLVPQDPNDEPTRALLARIRAERIDNVSRKTKLKKKRNT